MRRASAALAVAVAMAGCLSVKPLVLDRQAQLEKQILGRLSRLEADVILASSVRAGKAPGAASRQRHRTRAPRPGESDEPRAKARRHKTRAPVSPLQHELRTVQRDRLFRSDDIDALKDAGVVGEGRDGKLATLAAPRDKVRRARVARLVAAENADRGRLLQALIAADAELLPKDLPLLKKILARLQRAAARPGQKIQRDDGRWITVPRPTAEAS